MTSTCRRCHAPIEWAITLLGKRMPLDAGEPADPERANVARWIDGDGVIRARALARGERPAAYERLAMPHFATCPSWGQLERRKRAGT